LKEPCKNIENKQTICR